MIEINGVKMDPIGPVQIFTKPIYDTTGEVLIAWEHAITIQTLEVAPPPTKENPDNPT